MNKLALTFFLSAISATTFAASTGTITFNGELTDSTCNVSINGQGADAQVTLPTVSISDLSQDSLVAGRTSFNLNLSDCVVGTANGKSRVAAFFQPGPTVDLSSGRLNASGTAQNVQLQLLDASNSFNVINVGNTNQIDNMEFIDISAGEAVLPYAVEYYAQGQTTPGTVTSSVIYNLQYK